MTVKNDAHFVDCDKGTGTATEWSSGTKDFKPDIFVAYSAAVPSASISKYTSTNALDTTWATAGNFPYITSTWSYHFLLNTSDGGLLFGHNIDSANTTNTYSTPFTSPVVGTISAGDTITAAGRGTARVAAISYVSATVGVIYWDTLVGDNFVGFDILTSNGNSVKMNGNANNKSKITKLDSDGVIDTTWGDSGHVTTFATQPVTSIEDSSGNFYVGFWGPDRESVIKLDSSGAIQWTMSFSTSGEEVQSLIMSGTRLIVGTVSGSSTSSSVLVALDTSDGSVDTTWGSSGFALPLITGSRAEAIRKDSDGKLYVHFTAGISDLSLARFNADGSIDTTYGTNGFTGSGQVPVFNDKFSWNNTIDFAGGVLYAVTKPFGVRTTVYVNSYDSAGVETRLKTITGLGNEPVKCIVGGGGTIYLGGNNVDLESAGSSTVHFYSYNMVYIDQYIPIASVTNIIKLIDEDDAIFTGEQARTVAFPQDHAHLNGQTVQGLGDGSYLGTEVVVNGDVTMDDSTTTNHVGLQYTSKLLPMKIDGEVKVKRISKIIPNFNETVGGDYGESEDNLYSMVLRSSGDPMDTDGVLNTGHIELPFNGTYQRNADIWIRQTEPFPLKLLGIGVQFSKERV